MTVSGQAALAAIQLLSTFVLARLLVPGDFGLLAMVATLVAFVSLFEDFGLTQATTNARAISQRQLTGLFWFSVVGSVLLSLATAAMGPIIAGFYEQSELVPITLVFAVVVLVNGLGTMPRAILSRQIAFRWVVISEVISGVVGMLVAFGIALAGGGYWALVAIPVVRSALVTVYIWIKVPWRPGRPQRGSGILPLLDFGAKLSASNFANFMNRNADDVLVGWRWGPSALGQYAAAYRVLMMPLNQISAPVSRIALPALARLHDDPGRYRAAYLRIVRVLVSVTAPLMGFTAVSSAWVVVILLGPGWEEAAQILMWLALAGIVQPLSNSTGWLFLTQGRLGELLRWSVVSAVVAVMSFLIGLPYGAVGVAAAYAISGIALRFPLLLWWTGRSGPVSVMDLVRVFALPLVLTLLVSSASLFVQWLLPQAAPVQGVALSIALASIGIMAVLATPAGRGLRSDARVILGDLKRYREPAS